MGINWQDINLCLGIINGVWGILNIGVSIWGYLNHKNKKTFLNELQSHYENARKEHEKVCRRCRKEHERNLGILEKENSELLSIVKSVRQ